MKTWIQKTVIISLLALIAQGCAGGNTGTQERPPAQLPVSIAQRQASVLTPMSGGSEDTAQEVLSEPTEGADPTSPTGTETLAPSPSASITSQPSETSTPTNPPPQPSNTPAPPTNSPASTSVPPTNTAEPTNPEPVVCSPSGSSAYESEVIQLINQARSGEGLPALTNQSQLTSAARIHSDDMACNNFFSHTSPTTGSPFDRITAAGYSYSWAGENIGAGYPTPADVVSAWLNSAGHRANILNTNYTHIGIGYAAWPDSDYGVYWTAVFAAP